MKFTGSADWPDRHNRSNRPGNAGAGRVAGWWPLLEEILRIAPGAGPVLLVSGPKDGRKSRMDRVAGGSVLRAPEIEQRIEAAFGPVWPCCNVTLTADVPTRGDRLSHAPVAVVAAPHAWPLASDATAAMVVLPSAIQAALRVPEAREELLRVLSDGGHLLCVGAVGWMMQARWLADSELRLRGRSIWSLCGTRTSPEGRSACRSTWLARADTLLAPQLAPFASGQALWLQRTTMRVTPLRPAAARIAPGRWSSGLAISRQPCNRNPLPRRNET